MTDTPFIGRLEAVGFGKETTKGTKVNPSFWLPKTSGNLKPIVEQTMDDSGLGVLEENSDSYKTMETSEFAVEGILRDDYAGLFFLSALGKVDTVSPEAGVYSHLFSVEQHNNHPSLTVHGINPYLKTNAKSIYSTYSMLETLELNIESGNYVRFNLDMKGKAIKEETPAVIPAFTLGNEFISGHVNVKIANDIAGLTMATPIKVKNMRLTIAKNLEMVQELGSTDVATIHNKQLSVDGEITGLYKDQTFFDLVKNSTNQVMEITIKNTDKTIGVLGNPTITITLNKIKFTEWDKTDDNNELIEQTVGFSSMINTLTAKSIEISLLNTTASY